MPDSPADTEALLHAWRQSGAGRRHGMASHRIEALAARAARLQGQARHHLDARLRTLIESDMSARPASGAEGAGPIDVATSGASASSATGLAALVLRLSGHRVAFGEASALDSSASPSGGRAGSPPGDATDAVDATDAPTTLPALDAIRATWAQLRNATHLQHIVAEVPEDAGPMHSTVLVHRAIALMHEVAPAYLQHFLGYVDALAGLERLSPTPATTPAPRPPRPRRPASPANASGPGKAPRRRSRGRRQPA